MEACGLSGRGSQTRMMELTGWSKATMSQLYNNTQDYSPKVLTEAARALNAEEWELLMPPERAMRLRRIQADATEIAKLASENGGTEFVLRRASKGEPDDASKVAQGGKR